MIRSIRLSLVSALGAALLVTACGGPAAPGDPTPGPATVPPATVAPPTVAATAAPVETQGPTGPASLDGPATVEAGADFEVAWTGPNGARDFVTLVAAGAAGWTNEDYFYTSDGSPGDLTAPSKPGAYELLYIDGEDDSVLARSAIQITPFSGDLLAPDEVPANTNFEVAWNGPDGSGDYITIVKAGATRWTNEDYFYTYEGNPGTLVAPVAAGAYEIWYVIGSDDSIPARRPITVIAAVVTLGAPEQVQPSAKFNVTWEGPDGPGDYVTIVEVGAAKGAYLSYFYTYVGNPGELTAPDVPGNYELRYVAGQGEEILLAVPIRVG
jgi:Ca-activated chloride channel family protein